MKQERAVGTRLQCRSRPDAQGRLAPNRRIARLVVVSQHGESPWISQNAATEDIANRGTSDRLEARLLANRIEERSRLHAFEIRLSTAMS
jgi:hypothetical protein